MDCIKRVKLDSNAVNKQNFPAPIESPFRRTFASADECVILVLGHEDRKSIFLKKDESVNTRLGLIHFNDLIGKPFGIKRKGFVRMLPMTPALWTDTLFHRTQILYSTDCAMITRCLDLVPGKRVFEAGTGSGSLTHTLAQAVWPNGKVWTFDFHENRAKQAMQEFKDHKIDSVVCAEHRDVIGNGFPTDFDENGSNLRCVDAVVLDLPNPWKIIEKLRLYMFPNKVCVFLPCIEQVQQTCSALKRCGFKEITMMEVLLRQHSVRKTQMNIPNMGQKFIKYDETTGDVSVLQPMKSLPSCFPHPQAKFSDPDNMKTGYLYECAPQKTMPGHTGYLTFASLIPLRSPPVEQ